MNRRWVWTPLATVVLAALLGGGVVGCGGELDLAQQQSRVIHSPDPDIVLAAAGRILQREFGRLRINRETRTIETEPVEFTTRKASGSARDFYGGRSTMRRTARLSVARRGGDVLARLRIDLERQDTQRVAVQPPTGGLTDSPASTAIERDAATTEQQNQVWTRVRRDERLERALLDELQAEFAPRVSATAPAAEPVEEPAPDAATP